MQDRSEVPPYPGHSVYQESFFFCTIRNFGDDPGAGDIYVEIAVDGNCRLAFAKIYSARNAMNAVDLLQTRVLPFFQRHGTAIERVFTPKRNEYCGLAPAHPFETFLSTSRIQHLEIDGSGHYQGSVCGQLFQILRQDFFSLALRKRFHQSIEGLQRDLDAFLDKYNSERSGLGPNTQARPPLRAFLDSVQS